MKFKCGPTIAERAAKEKAEQEKLHANFVWKPWFAWRPIKVGDGDCRWLEIIERRPWYSRHYSQYEIRAEGADCHYIDYDYGYSYRVINKG